MSSQRWQRWQASWTLKSTWFKTSGGAKRSSELLIMQLGVFQGPTLLPDSATPRISYDNGPQGNTLPWVSQASSQSLILPLVQEGGAKQGHNSESPLYWALPPQAGLWEVSIIFHNYFRHNAVSHIGMWAHAFLWRQAGWRSWKISMIHQQPCPAMKEMPQHLMKRENDKIDTKSKIKVD